MPMTDGTLTDDKITVLLFGVGIAAVVVTLYHCMAACWCNRHRSRNAAAAAQTPVTEVLEFPSSLETSVAQLIPAHKYQKDSSLVVGDGTCAVCLSEFEDGEELRTMPECLHSFHAPCIDMWLYSHPNCPMCRTGATPSPQPFGRSPEDSGPGAGETVDSGVFRNYGMLQNIVVQSRYSNTLIT